MNGEIWKLAHLLYHARKREAWGHGNYTNTFPDLDDAKAMRAYPHNPVAEVDLALAQAKAVLKAGYVTPAGAEERDDG
jgi:hypothetical protein